MVSELLQKPFEVDILVETVEDRNIYKKLQDLQVNIGDLKSWSPTHKQLSDLLDALLRLKDPEAVFSELLPNRIKENQDNNSATNQYRKKPRDNDNEIIIAVIEEAFKFLGSEWLSIFYYHLAKLGIEKDSIVRHTPAFIEALHDVFGAGSEIIRARILETMKKNEDLITRNESIASFARILKETEYSPNNPREVNKIDA